MSTETIAHAPHVIETIPTAEPRRPRPIAGYTHNPPAQSRDPWGTHPTGAALFDQARDRARSQLGTVHRATLEPMTGTVTITVEDYARLVGAL